MGGKDRTATPRADQRRALWTKNMLNNGLMEDKMAATEVL